MDIREELKSANTYPSGPVSAWPRARHEKLMGGQAQKKSKAQAKGATKVKASTSQMARGLISNAATAMTRGKVNQAVRAERWETCRACPAFIHSSERCSDCGCLMSLKTWLNGDPDKLCPQQKWKR